MGSRNPPAPTLTAAQRDAAAATLRELSKAVQACAADAWIHVDLVGDLGALLARLSTRLPSEWGQLASARMNQQLGGGTDSSNAVAALLHVQTLIAGAVDVPGAGGQLHAAASSAYRASRDMLAALLAPTSGQRERLIADADAHLAHAHALLAAQRRPRHGSDTDE